MNLMKFKGADDAVKLTIRLSAGYCIILTIAFASSIIFLINKIEKAYGQALVIDRQGEVYEASSLSASDMRQYEYMNHVKTFVPTGMPLTRAATRRTFRLRSTS